MLIKLRKRIAQSTLEYAVLAVVVIAALLSIQNYLKRGIQGKIKSSTDDISAEQYDTQSTKYKKVTNTESMGAQENVTNEGTRTKLGDAGEITNTISTSNTETNSTGGFIGNGNIQLESTQVD